ncbi:Tim44 domain-containing protein [Enterococcus hermanniensis]|uniref:Tim44-like domain-containing protein n=1 Tax=Enterococcus hermanniensis TaxID=249189 RepID=A0A1L8TL85_9ENTE|nr:hypothetical protein [Enterococcus hermanniensis]OJG44882.1 hypothetical protein RV04_GL000450 [Enterococcus hermanniensis]
MKKIIILIAFIFLFLTAFPSHSAAVAGGHGGGSSSRVSSYHSSRSTSFRNTGRSTTYYSTSIRFLSPFRTFILYFLFISTVGISLIRKKVQSYQVSEAVRKEFLAALPGDKRNKKHLIQEIKKIFLTIQTSWNQSTLAIAKDCYTPTLYQNHLSILNAQQTQGIKNRTEKISLKKLSNFRIIHENSFSVQLYFTCLDYEEVVDTGQIISGSHRKKQAFLQTWYFNYDATDKRWKADFIQPINLN